ncbi:MAG: choice-of-anchor D domain-containing protein, partial [Candidatus Solibacter sp.]|nr:choice-of-anchor D domain-containing protein [Candidatus Solibacter sp.]
MAWTASITPNVAGYYIFRSTASGGPYTKVNSSPVIGTTWADIDVVGGQTYYYVATAVDGSNVESVYSNEATAVIPSSPPPPSACDLNSDGSVSIVDVQRATSQALGVAPCTADLNRSGFCDVGDVQRVINAALGGACVVGMGSPPAPPTGLTATPAAAAVNLSWTASTSANVIGYVVYRNNAYIADVGTAVSYVDTTVAPGNAYSYVVAAYNSAGDISPVSQLAQQLLGTYTVNYRWNTGGCSFSDPNPYHCAGSPGPIYVTAAPGKYKAVVTRLGPNPNGLARMWDGDSSNGTVYELPQGANVSFDHTFGQIVLYYWDWVPEDNPPDVWTEVQLYTTFEVFTPPVSKLDTNPLFLDFGNVLVGQQSAPRPVVLSNPGSTPIPITSILANKPEFPIAHACPATLNPGVNCTIQVSFKPGAAGVSSGLLNITSSLGVTAVQLTGNGTIVKLATVTPNPLVFPNLRPGQTSQPFPVVVTNTGNASLSIASLAVSNPAFKIVSGGAATLTPGATYQISLTYTAGGAVEQETGQLTINYTGNDPAPSMVTLSGICLIDTDGDGLPDKWEREGVTINGEFLDLPALGAKENYPDIFVFADYMEDTATGHSHKPGLAALDSVIAAFKQELRNPKDAFCLSGQPCTGIALHVEVPSSGVPLAAVLGSWTGDVYNWSAFDMIRNGAAGQAARLSSARASVYHYCLF